MDFWYRFGLIRVWGYRQPRHDRGSVESEVKAYLRKRRLLRSGVVGIKDPLTSARKKKSASSSKRVQSK